MEIFKKSSCQLMAKECTLSTGKLPVGGLPRNNMVKITLTDRPDMTSAVNWGRTRGDPEVIGLSHYSVTCGCISMKLAIRTKHSFSYAPVSTFYLCYV